MLDCLTYIAFVYWAVSTVHTILPIDVAMCKSFGSGLSGGFLHHTFGGDVTLDVREWAGYPCKTNLLFKFLFILRRPGPAVRHILYGGGQDEPYVPILFLVPLVFLTVTLLQHLLRVRIVSPTVLRTFLKFGIAIGCRALIILQSIRDPLKQSLYYKRYSKVELFIVAWTAYIIELPVSHEALVSGGTLATILMMCCLFPHHMLPEVDPRIVALQAILATAFGVGYSTYQQQRRRRLHPQQRPIGQWAAAAAGGRPMGSKKSCADMMAGDEDYYACEKLAADSCTEAVLTSSYGSTTIAAGSNTATPPLGTLPAAPASCSSSSDPSVRGDNNPATTATTTAAITTTTTTTTSPTSTVGAAGLPRQQRSLPQSAESPQLATTADQCSSNCATQFPTVPRAADIQSPRHHGRIPRTVSYVSRARPYRFAVKIQHAHLADLPPNLMNVVNERVLRGSGFQAIRVHAREGCVELVLDLRPVQPVRRFRNAGDAALVAAAMSVATTATGDDSRPEPDQYPSTTADLLIDDEDDDIAAGPLDAAALSQLGVAIVSYLHSSGLLQPHQEPSVVLQVGDEAVVVSWQPESQTWGTAAAAPPPPASSGVVVTPPSDSDGAGCADGTLPPPPLVTTGVPMLTSVSPCVVTWPGPDVPVRLTVALRGPSAEEILAGGGLVVRGRGNPLPYSVVRVTRDAMTTAVAEVAEAAPLLLAVVDVSAVPWSGLLQVEARSRTGLLSTARTVVVDPDEQLVSGLRLLVSYMDDESTDAVLLDYGTWMEVAAEAGLSEGGKAAFFGDCCGDGDRAVDPAAVSAAVTAARGSNATTETSCPSYSLDLIRELRDQQPEGTCGGGGGGSTTSMTSSSISSPLPRQSMLAVAADLLVACCQAGGADIALAAVADRLIAMVIACDGRPCGTALTELLNAVRSPPMNASALHLAVASGSRPVAEVLLRWHTKVVLEPSASAAAAAAAGGNLWLDRAAAGVTPLHVVAAAADCGVLAVWALTHYPAAAAAWRTVRRDDGATPAALAGRQGGRWRLRLWYGNPVVLWIRRAVAWRRTAALGGVWELFWGFRDGGQEQRYLTALYNQATLPLALYVGLSALVPVSCLTKAALCGRPENILTALAFHGPSTAPLLAWLSSVTRHPTKPSVTASVTTNTITATVTTTSNTSAAKGRCPYPLSQQATVSEPPRNLNVGGSNRSDCSGGGGGGGGGGGVRRSACSCEVHNWAVLLMQLLRAAAKAAVGLSVGPFTLPSCAPGFVASGSDIALEALVRPLLEQVSLPARLLVSLVDGPAMYVFYQSLELRYPGSVARPLARALVYQAVLIAATAAICGVSRARFLRLASEGASGI